MSELPRHTVTRTARLATLPVGYAGRTALGTSKRLGGRSAELVTQEIQQRTAEQVFRVLGELKGGAMKLGQALSVFEAALPPEIAEPYRATLTRLQESAPPLPAQAIHKVLVGDSNYRVEEADETQLDENGNPKPRPNRDKKPKIYPNLGVETTVIGDYSNLRRFLSDLERSKQFLIVNSLAFQGGDERIARQLTKGGKQPILNSPESIPVSLKLELDTYFKPSTVGAATAQSATAAPKNAR